MGSYYRNLELTENEESKLAYIQSNKFITLRSFHRKFLKNKTEAAAWYQLEKFCKFDPPLLERLRGSHFEERFYRLTAAALKYLDFENRILVRNPRFPNGMRAQSYEHDCRVIALRVSFEENPDLMNVFWVSDFEMRTGVTPEIKAGFIAGKLNKTTWRYNRDKDLFHWKEGDLKGGPKNQYPRTPDGYMEADLDGRREIFVFEYIHQSYSRQTLDRMVYQLESDPVFSKGYKLIVSKNTEDAESLIPRLKERVKEKEKWFVGDYERALTAPFKKVWFNLGKSELIPVEN